MAGDYDELVVIDNHNPGLNLVSAPATFQPGETDMNDDTWLHLDGSVSMRPPIESILETFHTGPNRVTTPADPELLTVALLSYAQAAALLIVGYDTAAKNTWHWWNDDLSPNVAPPSPADLKFNSQTAGTVTRAVTVPWRVPSVAQHETGVYMTRPDGRVLKFTIGGTSAPVLLTAVQTDEASRTLWNDDYSAPQNAVNVASVTGVFPLADVILAVNAGSTVWMFAGRGTTVRWSHSSTTVIPSGNPARLYGPQDWALNDYVDIPSVGAVTALAHYEDHVLVFGQSEVQALYGSPPELSNTRLSGALGTQSMSSVAVGPEGVFFYSHPEGVYVWDGSRMTHLSAKLGSFEGVDDQEVLSRVAVGYRDRRVWFSFPAGEKRGTYVLDLRSGGWVKHTYLCSQFLTYAIGAGTGALLGVVPSGGGVVSGVYEIGDDRVGGTGVVDRLPKGGSRKIEAKLRVGPVGGGAADMRPRWRNVVVAAPEVEGMMVDVEYDQRTRRGSRLLPEPVQGLSRLGCVGRAWRCALVLRWSSGGRLVRCIFRWWPGRREGNAEVVSGA